MVRKTCITVLMGIFGAGALLILSCGGGGSSSTSMALSGTWVSECFDIGGDTWGWERYVFDGKTGNFSGFEEIFNNGDCYGPGAVQKSVVGTYSTGSEVDCPSGYESKCRELDMTYEGKDPGYGVYSHFPGDPSQMYLSSMAGDPASRPDDVNIVGGHPFRNVPCPGCTGEAIIGLTVIDSGYTGAPPVMQGWTAIPLDLNAGHLLPATYVWLYYRMGRADGLDGAPISRVYTVHESDGETPLSDTDTKINVNLNGSTAASNFLYLYYRKATGPGPVVRCMVAANETDKVTLYGPPSAAGLYTITWVEELDPDSWKTPSEFPQPPDAQDLNENFGGDWIFLGYGRD